VFDPQPPVGTELQFSVENGFVSLQLELRSSGVRPPKVETAQHETPVLPPKLSSDPLYQTLAAASCFVAICSRFVAGVSRPPSFDDFPAP